MLAVGVAAGWLGSCAWRAVRSFSCRRLCPRLSAPIGGSRSLARPGDRIFRLFRNSPAILAVGRVAAWRANIAAHGRTQPARHVRSQAAHVRRFRVCRSPLPADRTGAPACARRCRRTSPAPAASTPRYRGSAVQSASHGASHRPGRHRSGHRPPPRYCSGDM